MILPVRKETILLTESPEDFTDRLKYVTGKRKTGDYRERPVKFIGKGEEAGWAITRFVTRPENFMPLVQGKLEHVSRGCLLSIRYTLQFSSRMFVVFWTITTLLFAIFLWFIQSDVRLGLIALGFLLLNIVVTHLNFQRQYRQTRKILMDVIDS